MESTTEYVGTARSQRIGFVAIFVMWITAAVSVPFSKILFRKFGFSAEEVLIVRSAACMLAAFAIGRGKAWRSQPIIILSGFIIGISSVTFYRAISSWSVNPVAVMLTLTPVVNMAIAVYHGKKVSRTVFVSLICLIAGTTWVLEPWNTPLQVSGFLWSLSCVLLGAFGFEMWAKAPKNTTVSEKCFWLSFWVAIMSFAIIKIGGHDVRYRKMIEPEVWPTMAIFAATVTAYIFCSIVPFNTVGKINTVKAIVLMQIATPVTIVGADLFLGEKLSARQWAGVWCALIGATLLSIQTLRAQDTKPSSS